MIISIFQQRFVRLSKYLTEMGTASSQSRSWGWPCALWATCPMRWSWRLSSKDLIWMVSVSLSLWLSKFTSAQAVAYNPTHKLHTDMMFVLLSVLLGDGQVGFEEFVTLLGPKLSAAGMPDKFHGADFDSVFWKVCQHHLQHNHRHLSNIDSSMTKQTTIAFW